MSHTEQVYGLFPGGDPRRFQPEVSQCSPAEVEAWKRACAEWDAGTGTDRGPSCGTFGDGSAWTGTGYGIGTYEVDFTDEEWAYVNADEESERAA